MTTTLRKLIAGCCGSWRLESKAVVPERDRCRHFTADHMKKPYKNQALKWGSALCLGLLAIQRGAAEFVEIAAEIELISHRVGETNDAASAKPRTISLVCITGTNEWRIDNDFVQGAEEKWLFDGTNVYNSLRISEPLSDETRDKIAKTSGLATVPAERAKPTLTIYIWGSRDGHPLGDLGVNIPWLAFCSGTYLRREGRLVPLPAGMLHNTRDRFAYTDKTESFPDAFGLPQIVELFTSRSLYQASEDDFDKESFFGDRYAESTKKTASTLQEGILTFHYAVAESTNFLGWNFPTKFEFFQNGRNYEQNGDWFYHGIGRVKSIRPSAKPEGLFVPSLQQTIVDWRFRDSTAKVDGIIYTSTNGFASPTNDPSLQSKFKAWVERAARQKAVAK